MNHPTNIHSNGQKQYLSVGIYSVKVFGGWGVTVNDFSANLRKAESDLVIKAEVTYGDINHMHLRNEREEF